jgi:D-proline reductase (dithiol) PrdB
VLVDSYRFLPRSFVGIYEQLEPAPGDTEPVWAPFERRLSEASIALLSSAGLSLAGEQTPFDLERERREPEWGDPSHRVIPHLTEAELVMSHLHVNNTDVLADRNVALPMDGLEDVAREGRIARATAGHVSVMGYQQYGLEEWRTQTAPRIVDLLREEGADGVVLAPV